MTSTIAEMVMGYGFAILLFAGLPAILFLVVFLPALMRTTGETIGSSARRPVLSKTVPTLRPLARAAALTMANTA